MKNIYFLLIILILGMGMISCTSPRKEKRAKLEQQTHPIIEDPTDTFYIVNTMTSERIRIIVKNDKGTRIDYPNTYVITQN